MNTTRTSILATVTATTAAMLLAGAAGTASAHEAGSSATVVGHVFEATNAASGNALAVFDRHLDGSLHPAGNIATGGLGAGASLHSQGGVARDGRLVFVVNAGDDSVSALASTRDGLVLRDRISTGGDFPVSVTVRDGVGYVLNQGNDTIHGFRYDDDGDLHSLPGSTRSLTANPAGGTTDAAQVSFTPDGRSLVVTEKAANRIETFRVVGGYAGNARPHLSAGTTPYGFDFDRRGHLIVSEAATGSASSYSVRPFGPITSALTDTQKAACWLVVAGDWAYVVNAASTSISSYHVSRDGSLTLAAAVAATTGAGPTDAAVSSDRRTLSVRLGDGSVSSFRIGSHGELTATGTAAGTAYGTSGLVAD
jgi:6-phosphogluconolactonase (cycloisomerase 2 family)